MEQALFLDSKLGGIKAILNVAAPDEVLKARLKSRGASSGRADDQDDNIIQDRLNVFRGQSEPVIHFYEKYGVVKNIDSCLDINQAYKQVKESLLPEVYCIAGKKYSGKSTISRSLSYRMNMKWIDFEEFVAKPQLLESSKEDIILSFIEELRKISEARVIVENFPLDKEMFVLFNKNGRPIYKIILLTCDDAVCTKRMMNLKGTNEFIGAGALRKKNEEFKKLRDLFAFFKSKSLVTEVDSSGDLKLTINNLISELKPVILSLKISSEVDHLKSNFINDFANNGYDVINIDDILEESAKRGNEEAQAYIDSPNSGNLGKVINNVLKDILFNEKKRKFVLLNFPKTEEDVYF